MANLSAMTNRVQMLVGKHSLATTDLVTSLINSRHNDLLESYDWSRKKAEMIVSAQLDKSAGTITATNGSPTLIGAGTAFTASDVSKSIKLGSDQYSLYVVRTVPLATVLTLSDLSGNVVNYAGATAAGLSYVMFKRLYSLGRGIGSILSVKNQTPLKEVSQEYLDDIDPARINCASTGPYCYARGPWNQTQPDDEITIEFYPRPTSATIITVEVKKSHLDLLPAQNPIVPSPPLEWFAAVDCSYALFARTKEPKWLELAMAFNKEGVQSLEYEKNEDARKFGQIQRVRDVGGAMPLGTTDFGIDHDVF